jgi:hypothetical protein
MGRCFDLTGGRNSPCCAGCRFTILSMREFRPTFRRPSFVLTLLAALVPSLRAAPCGSDAATPISTDRPQITEASTVVPCGSLQFENGFAVTGNGSRHGLDLPETWMRWGVPAKGEIRFAVPDYFTNDDTALGFTSGASDVVLGYKLQLGPTHGFDVSIIPSLSFPSGSKGITSGGYDPFIQVPWSRSLSKNWTVAGMFALADPTQPSGRNLTGQGTLYFDRQLTALLDAWAEYSGSFPQRGGPQNLINLGACLKPTPHQQIDFHWSYGLSAAAPDYSLGLGYSVRFQITRRH